MKIATNVQRDAFGGITISNLALFDWLEDKSDTIVGIEYITARHFLGAAIFRRYQPSFFSHHIINGIDVIDKYRWERTNNLKKRWSILIEATKEALKQEMPDVVLLNGTSYAPWILGQAATELGIPIVLRYAGILQREVTHLPFLARLRLHAHERWIASIANATIFPSTLCKQVVETEILRTTVKNSLVIPNPVQDAHKVPSNKRGLKRFTIAAVGRWSRVKNFEAFVALHEQLLRSRWPHRAVLVTSYRGDIFYIPESIERVDPMDRDELRKFYRSVDLVIVPSHFETFCNVAAEAVINGTAVLVSEQVGFAEVLHQAGLSRMVVKSFDDPAVVAKAVKRLAKNKLTRAERDAVAKLLDPHVVHEEIIELLERVVRAETID